MKLAKTFRALAVACAFAATASASAAPILSVNSDGILMGVKNLEVSGKLYDVAIGDGTCSSLFNGCSNAGFAFWTLEAARGASDALLNSLSTEFVDAPSRISGCTSTIDCFIAIPYMVNNLRFSSTAVCIFSAGSDEVSSSACGVSGGVESNLSEDSGITFARFQLAAPTDIPEPSSLALMGLTMAGLAFNRRRKA